MELFKILGTIALNGADQAEKDMDSVTGKAGSVASKIGGAVSAIGGFVVKAGAVVASGVAAAATGIAAVTKQSTDLYADFEQLVGGVETLFGAGGESIEEYAERMGKSVDEVQDKYNYLMTAQTEVLNNAKKAYKTAGLSANEYMETVTSFSASLIQSLGGDTQKAAEMADMAIVDMADNANKMGSDMTSIQNAYQGFAKQNYTMLDNLKLGYGGTAEEMYRLMSTAADLDETFKKTAKFSIDSKGHLTAGYADIVQAIHIVQTEMGIAETTSKEAATTISGSFGMLKASWSNFLTAFGDDKGIFENTVQDLVDSAQTYIRNIVPRITIILPKLIEGFSQLVKELTPHIQPLLELLLPPLLEGAVHLVSYIVTNLPSLIMTLGTALWDALKLMFSEIKGMLPEEANGIFSEISEGLSNAWASCLAVWESVGKPIFDAILEAIQYLYENWDEISAYISEVFSNIWEVCLGAWESVGKPVFDAILETINWVAENWDEISATISTYFQIVMDYWQTAWDNIGKPTWDMISMAVSELWSTFQKHMPEIMAFFQEAMSGIKDTWENHLKPTFEAIGAFLNNVLKPAFEFVFKTIIIPLITNTFKEIAKLWKNSLKPILDGICDFLLGVFTGDWKKAFEGILKIVNGIFHGIETVVNSTIDTMKEVVSKGIDFIKEKFNFEWKLPNLKLPHFKIDGEFSLDPPSVPTFGIDWYAKAMDDPMIMNSPTAFGLNKNGQIMAGGEAGSEVVSGTDTLMNMISDAVSAKNERLEEILQSILSYMPQMANMQLVTDTGALVGALAPGMDKELGKIATRKGRNM